MNLFGSETLWVFVSGSDENRFLNDISFGIECLRHRGTPLSSILIFIDQPSGKNFVNNHGFPREILIYNTGDFNSVLNYKSPSRLVVLVTGHGNGTGIAAQQDIKPYQLLDIRKSINNLECALIVLGQCYAGTFNFIEARNVDEAGKEIPPQICIIGATDLHISISSVIDVSDLSKHPELGSFQCAKRWLANLFLFFFAYYIAFPKDVDGDGKVTVADTYKSAGIGANQLLINAKQHAFFEMYSILTKSGIHQSSQNPSIQQLAQKAQEDYLRVSEIVLASQDPWILHANFARTLEL